MSEADRVTKEVAVERLFDTNGEAHREADQVTRYPGMLNRLTPAPQTYQVEVKVLKAEVFESKSATTKAKTRIVVIATADKEKSIDGWATDFNKMHGLQAVDGLAARKQLQEAAAKAKAEADAD